MAKPCRGDPAAAGRPLRPERSPAEKAGPHPVYNCDISFLNAIPPLYDLICLSLASASPREANSSEYIKMKGILYLVDRCLPEL